MIIKHCYLLIVLLLIFGCSKKAEDILDNYPIDSATININAVQNGKYDEIFYPMTPLEISKFKEWILTHKHLGEKKAKGGGYPLWCVAFNPNINKKAIAYCVPKDRSGLWLQVTLYNDTWVYYPLNEEDKKYFKANLTVLKNIDF